MSSDWTSRLERINEDLRTVAGNSFRAHARTRRTAAHLLAHQQARGIEAREEARRVPGLTSWLDDVRRESDALRAELARKDAEAERLRTQVRWLLSGGTGASSEAIFRHMTGAGGEPYELSRVPFDSSDFGRCRELLGRFPEWRSRLHEMGAHSQCWAEMARSWGRIEGLLDIGDPGAATRVIRSIALGEEVRDAE